MIKGNLIYEFSLTDVYNFMPVTNRVYAFEQDNKLKNLIVIDDRVLIRLSKTK
jgi:hypothetical protein